MIPETAVFKTADKATRDAKTLDGFVNFVSKLGIGPQQQNNLSAGGYTFNLWTRQRAQLEAAYRGSWVVGQIIDSVAEDMSRAGITITTNEAAQNITKLQSTLSRLQVWQSICSLIKWGRLYGGAIGVIQIEGQQLSTPLNLDSVSKGQFKGIGVYDRWQLNPDLVNVITSGPEIGLPKFYNIVLGNELNNPAPTPTGQITVHHSRCIRMIGIELPFWQAMTEMMWGESLLERVWDRLIAFDDTTLSSANLVDRASLRTVKVEGLREIIAAGGKAEQGLMAMFEMVRRFQSNEGLTLLDKNDEFQSTNYSFAGLSDILLQFGQQVAGASGIPLVRLFGQSPAGLNATGEADIRMYYDNINAQQESRLRNPFEIILRVLYRSTFGENMPDDLEFTFTPLWQMSSKDKADIAKINTETIIAAHQEGAIDTPTMMQELRDTQGDFGLFANITDEMIEAAKLEPAPLPNEGEIPDDDKSSQSEKPAVKNIDSVNGSSPWKRIQKWLKRKKIDDEWEEGDPRKSNGQFGSGGGGSSGGSQYPIESKTSPASSSQSGPKETSSEPPSSSHFGKNEKFSLKKKSSGGSSSSKAAARLKRALSGPSKGYSVEKRKEYKQRLENETDPEIRAELEKVIKAHTDRLKW